MERDLRARGFRLIAGADEAGRGALFGPVAAAAVILSPDRPVRGLDDSKQIEPEERERLAVLIRERAIAWSVAAADAATIDRINIYQASRLAMRRAVEQLTPAPDFLLTDAVPLDWRGPQRAVIHGDALSRTIAAASILAKVYRDDVLRGWDQAFPGYGLARNKGYGTPDHLAALVALGPAPLHRMSFEPVRSLARFPAASLQATLFEEPMAVACR